MKKLAVFSLIICLFFSSAELFAAKKKKSVPPPPQAPSPSFQIPDSVVDALSKEDIEGAAIILRDEKNNPKAKYLLKETTRIVTSEMEKKPSKTEAHKQYQNLGIAYHNLYLFLKSRGIDKEEFFKKAQKYYKKARGVGTLYHKQDCDLLTAALLAAAEKNEKAEKIFNKLDISAVHVDFTSLEYLAAYYAASGDAVSTVSALEEAFKVNPKGVVAWLAVSDDFHVIEKEPVFQAFVKNLSAPSSKAYVLSVPAGKKPALELNDSTGIFITKKEMPHKKLKKKKKKVRVSKKKSISVKKKVN